MLPRRVQYASNSGQGFNKQENQWFFNVFSVGPHRIQEGFKKLQDASRRFTTPPRRSKTVRRRLQDAPRRSKTSPRRSKTPPRRSKTPPRCLQDASKTRRAPKAANSLNTYEHQWFVNVFSVGTARFQEVLRGSKRPSRGSKTPSRRLQDASSL